MTALSNSLQPSQKDSLLGTGDVLSNRALLGSLRQPIDHSQLRNNDVVDPAVPALNSNFGPFNIPSSFSISMSSIAFLASIFKSVAITGMVLGGVVVFIPQYVEIWKSGNPDGFSTHVCLIMIIANLLRLCFWFAVRFETPLLLQSIFVTIAMLAMQELCVRCRLRKSFSSASSRQKNKRFIDLDFEHFWNWTYFSDYLYFLSMFFVLVAFITNIFIQSELFIDTLGFVALCMEALLLLPQLLRNFRRKSTDGLSCKMVIMMLCGDLFKTCYYLARSVPSQFWICSSLQVYMYTLTLILILL